LKKNVSVMNGSKMGANPSINTDWRDKAAPAGYVKRWASK